MMPQNLKRVLFVDDDENLLKALRRSIRNTIDMRTATSAVEGLRMLDKSGPFSVVVVDNNMPRIDGVALLQKVKESFPDTIRVMFTGNSDQATAARAVNEGNVFCFLTKPCPTETLLEKIDEAHAAHLKILEDRKIREDTLMGSVKLMSDMLSVTYPQAYARSRLVQRWARQAALSMDLKEIWDLKVASMLWPISETRMSPQLVARKNSGQALTKDELVKLVDANRTMVNMLSAIPRLKSVSQLILMSNTHFISSMPDAKRGLEARLLQILIDLSVRMDPADSTDLKAAFDALESSGTDYDMALLSALRTVLDRDPKADAATTALNLFIRELRRGDVLIEDLRDANGTILLAAGQSLTDTFISTLMRMGTIQPSHSCVRVVRAREKSAA